MDRAQLCCGIVPCLISILHQDINKILFIYCHFLHTGVFIDLNYEYLTNLKLQKTKFWVPVVGFGFLFKKGFPFDAYAFQRYTNSA